MLHTDNEPLIIAAVHGVKSPYAHSDKGLLHPNYLKAFFLLTTRAEREKREKFCLTRR